MSSDGTWWAVYAAADGDSPFLLRALSDQEVAAEEYARHLEEMAAKGGRVDRYVAVFEREDVPELWKPALSWEEAENGSVTRH